MPRSWTRIIIAGTLVGTFIGALIFAVYWQTRQRRLALSLRQIRTAVNQRLIAEEAQLNPEHTARELGLGWPVSPPDIPLDELERRLRDRVLDAVDNELPYAATLNRIRGDAEQRYPLIRLGDTVPVGLCVLLGLKDTGAIRFRLMADHRVLLGEEWVDRRTMSENNWRNFDEAMTGRQRQEYERQQMAPFLQKRKKLARQVLPELRHALFTAAGYVPLEGGKEWQAATDALAHALEKRRAVLRQRIEEEEYRARGFMLEKGAWRR